MTGLDHLLNSDQPLTSAWAASTGGPTACSGHRAPGITSSRLPIFAGLYARSTAQIVDEPSSSTGGGGGGAFYPVLPGGDEGSYAMEVRRREFV